MDRIMLFCFVRCVTPRHDLGTCCNYSSIEINRIRYPGIRSKKRLFFSLVWISFIITNCYSNRALDVAKKWRKKDLKANSELKSNGKFHASMSCIIDLFYLFLGQLRRDLVMNFSDVQIFWDLNHFAANSVQRNIGNSIKKYEASTIFINNLFVGGIGILRYCSKLCSSEASIKNQTNFQIKSQVKSLQNLDEFVRSLLFFFCFHERSKQQEKPISTKDFEQEEINPNLHDDGNLIYCLDGYAMLFL